mgnify:CR=1 FL=1
MSGLFVKLRGRGRPGKGVEDEDSNGHCVWRSWYLPIYQPLYVFCLIKNSTGGQRTMGCSG